MIEQTFEVDPLILFVILGAIIFIKIFFKILDIQTEVKLQELEEDYKKIEIEMERSKRC